jgi:hypothetical protein
MFKEFDYDDIIAITSLFNILLMLAIFIFKPERVTITTWVNLILMIIMLTISLTSVIIRRR